MAPGRVKPFFQDENVVPCRLTRLTSEARVTFQKPSPSHSGNPSGTGNYLTGHSLRMTSKAA
jgi:hypothetical protein